MTGKCFNLDFMYSRFKVEDIKISLEAEFCMCTRWTEKEALNY